MKSASAVAKLRNYDHGERGGGGIVGMLGGADYLEVGSHQRKIEGLSMAVS